MALVSSLDESEAFALYLLSYLFIYSKSLSHGRLLVVRIGISPFFFFKSRKKETRAIENEKKAKWLISQPNVARVNASFKGYARNWLY